MKRYNPKEIEPKWQDRWAESKIYEAVDGSSKSKRYVLEYFPYPSGAAMHVGHVRNYTIGDAVSRFARMNGHNVLHPMGWDAFGLPAENYAIKTGISPQQAIKQNTTRFKKQLTQMGFGYDWSREFSSTDPDYYKWTQWLFLLLFKRGLAYQKEALVNWDPVDKTVLANEQVIDGKAERSGATVEKKALKQWFFKITEYADRLENDLEDLNWSDAIKTMQRNWIGKSKGAEIDFKVDGSSEVIKVFTTRPDTLYGATFIVLAPEHSLVNDITTDEKKSEVEAYVRSAEAKSEIERQETEHEKTGVFTGAYVINPINDEKLPIWIADYVLSGYGTGAIMAVPAHDERDHEFAKKFNLPIHFVVEPTYGEPQGDDTHKDSIFGVLRNPKTNQVLILDWGPRQVRHGGIMLIGGGVEQGESPQAAAEREIREETGYTNFKFIKETEFSGHGYFFSNTKGKNMHVSGKGLLFDLVDEDKSETKLDEGERGKFKIRWEPINKVATMLDDAIHETIYRALIFDECYQGEGSIINSGSYNGMESSAVREKIVAGLEKKGEAKEVVNYKLRDWLISRQRYWGAPIPIIHCPKDGAQAVPEDQLPVMLPEVKDYKPSDDGRSPLANVPEFVNTTCPKCGGPAKRETDTMDGFACSSWYFLRFADPHDDQQAFAKDKVKYWLPVDDYIGGAEHAVMHLLYARFWTKVMHDEGLIDFDEPFKTLRNHGMILAPDGQKMSKSKGNTIEPDGLIEQGYGADSIRIMELFIGPWNHSANWSVEGMGGSFRFLQRVWTLTQEFIDSGTSKENEDDKLTKAVHRTVKKVTEDLHSMSFNTAIAAMMELTNDYYKHKEYVLKSSNGKWALETLLQLLAPFAPHIADELWEQLGHSESIHVSHWPKWEEKYLSVDTVNVAIQVNGKLRAELQLAPDSNEDQVVEAAKANENVQKYIDSKEITKTIYVPNKILNIVIK